MVKSKKSSLNSLKQGFTLVEVLIVVAIVAVLTVAVLIVLNPIEYLKQSRDALRLQDLGNLFKTLNYIKAESPQTYFGDPNTVYISRPDPNISSGTSTCPNMNLPNLPSGWKYQCVSKNTLQNIDGTGWLPLDLTKQAVFRLNKLPVDPKNDENNYYTYTYNPQTGNFEIDAVFESKKHQSLASEDNGDSQTIYELGTDLSLYPIGGIGNNLALKNESNQNIKNEGNFIIYVAQAASTGQVTFFIGSDQVTGDNNLYWDNTNKMLGIGTASPAQKLHVQGNAYFSGNVGIGISAPAGLLDVGNGKLVVTSDGKVGIGTTSPGAKLQVNGSGETIRMDGSGNQTYQAWYNGGTRAGYIGTGGGGIDTVFKSDRHMYLSVGGGDALFINTSGNVGIGTTNPTSRLHVVGAASNSLVNIVGDGTNDMGVTINSINTIRAASLTLKSGNTTWAPSYKEAAGGLVFWYGSNDFVTFGNTGNVLVKSGNVGIGTTNPTSKLYVAGDLTVTGTKNFEADYPGDPTKKIIYVALEGPEAGTYIRGTSVCENFETTITFPDYFRVVTAQNGLSASLTPRGSFSNLYIKELTNEHLIVGCETGKSFDYIVFGIRKGYENFEPVKQK